PLEVRHPPGALGARQGTGDDERVGEAGEQAEEDHDGAVEDHRLGSSSHARVLALRAARRKVWPPARHLCSSAAGPPEEVTPWIFASSISCSPPPAPSASVSTWHALSRPPFSSGRSRSPSRRRPDRTPRGGTSSW